MKNSHQLASEVLPRGVGIMCDWFAKEASNATITATNGKKYIDFAGGIGVLNTGHAHKKVIEAVKEQLDNFTHTCFQVVPYESYFELAKKINDLVPISGDVKSVFFSTGAEAVENAIKIARAYTKRSGIISFCGSFHGRTLATLGLTGKVNPYKNDFGVMQGGIFHIPFPSKTQDVSVKESLKALKRIFLSDLAPHDTAAIIIEPIQGEGGFNVAPKKLMKDLRKICDEYGIILITDEVQSGFARSGKYFAMEHFDVEPDIITMAKSLAGGFVLSGVAGKAKIMDAPNSGALGGTYAGNPLGIKAALAVIDIIEEENILERSNKLGDKLKSFLENLKIPEVSDIRGLGSMVAIEFGDDENPNATLALNIQKYALEEGLILLLCGVNKNVIRFLYPITIEDDLFDKALNIFENALKKAKS